MPSPDPQLQAILDRIEAGTAELADAHRQRATASTAYRREHSRVWSGLVSDQGKSSTEAQRWADAGTYVLRGELERLDGEIAALDATLAFHRDTLTVALATFHPHHKEGS